MDATPSMAALPKNIPNLPADFTRNWAEWPAEIVDAAREQASAVRVCQKVFCAELVPDALAVPDDSLDLPNITQIREKPEQPLVEVTMQFQLTAKQMDKEPQKKIGYFLAQMVGRTIGQVEDLILFQGRNASSPLLDPRLGVQVTNNTRTGLLGAANPGSDNTSDDDPTRVSVPIFVRLSEGARRGVLWGENLFSAVNDGVTKLSVKGQSTNYALLLPRAAFADLQTPPGDQSLVTTYERLSPWVNIYPTAMLPRDQGLLVAVSNAIALYVGVDALCEYTAKDQTFHNFVVRNKFLDIERDPRALVLLNLEQPAETPRT